MLKTNDKIIIYQPPEGLPALEVHLEAETVWLTLNQLSILFGRDKSVISRHIRNVYQTGELLQSSTVAKYATVQIESGRKVRRQIRYFDLGMTSFMYQVYNRDD